MILTLLYLAVKQNMLLCLFYDNFIRMDRHLFIMLLGIVAKNVWNY